MWAATRLRLPENTWELCVQRLTTAMSQCPAGPPAGTPPSSGAVLCPKYHWLPLERRSRHQPTTADFPFQECLFFISSGYRVATAARARIHYGKPDQTSALFLLVTAASMCSRGSDARHRWSWKNTSSPVNCRFRSPRKGFKRVHVQADLRREGHVELADKPTDHPGPR